MMWTIFHIDEHLKCLADSARDPTRSSYTDYREKVAALYTKSEDEEKYKKGHKGEGGGRDFLPIYCGDTVVGDLCYYDSRDLEYVTSKGDDPDILQLLHIWHDGRKLREERELKEERRRIKAEREIEKEEEAKKARKALGFD